MLVVKHSQNSSLSSMVRLVIVFYFCTLANVRPEDNEVFASDMTDIGLQFHEPDATPSTGYDFASGVTEVWDNRIAC